MLLIYTEPTRDAFEDEPKVESIEDDTTILRKGKSSSARAAALRKMMEESGTTSLNFACFYDTSFITAIDEEMKDAGQTPSQELQPKDGLRGLSPEPAITVSGGRRRARRKVMKKKTIKDEEGYLGV